MLSVRSTYIYICSNFLRPVWKHCDVICASPECTRRLRIFPCSAGWLDNPEGKTTQPGVYCTVGGGRREKPPFSAGGGEG
jgi:hypothetical protein